MNCEQFDRVSVQLLYGELDELTASESLRHLHHCPRCQKVYEELKTTKNSYEPTLTRPSPELLENLIQLEAQARAHLPFAERLGRTISVLAEYAMRPQAAMTAVLMIMLAVSALFIRNTQSSSARPIAQPEQRADIKSASQLGALPKARVYANDDETKALVEKKLPSEENDDALEPQRPQIPSYREAMAAFQAGRYATAEQLFHQVSLAGIEKSASASLQEAHSARNGSGCIRAAPLYLRVYQQYRQENLALEARWHAASCFRALGNYQKAKEELTILASTQAYKARANKALKSLESLTNRNAPQQRAAKEFQETTTSSAAKKNDKGSLRSKESEQ